MSTARGSSPTGPRCRGDNFSGQLGDGTDSDRLTPTTVIGLTDVVAGAGGDLHSCAVLADRTARCWGSNAGGQLGDGTTTDRLTPTPVTTLLKFTSGISIDLFFGSVAQIATGSAHTCALRANGAVFCWGLNATGQVGDGTTVDRLRPAAVPSFTLNIDPRVVLPAQEREAIVNVVGTCDEGQRLTVTVELTQGAVTGDGVGHLDCTGALETFPVRVHARGPESFAPGPAQGAAAAIIRDGGRVVDEQTWTRSVVITSAP